MQSHDPAPIVTAAHGIVAGEGAPLRVVPALASPDIALRESLEPPRTSASAAALRIIRHRLELRHADGMWSFGVTSARDGEGKSTLAAQLAVVLGESHRARVLLVEANLQRPSLARLLGCAVPPGIGFSLQMARRMGGGCDPWTVLALAPALHVLVESQSEGGVPETLYSAQFRSVVDRLARLYDWVIVDAPSVLGSGDANAVENAVDGMVIVARSRASKGADLKAAVRQLGERKAVGFVLCDSARESS